MVFDVLKHTLETKDKNYYIYQVIVKAIATLYKEKNLLDVQ